MLGTVCRCGEGRDPPFLPRIHLRPFMQVPYAAAYRRRMAQHLGLPVVGMLLGIGVLTAGCGQAVDEPAGLQGGERVAATSGALVAVALSHLTPAPDGIELREPGADIDDMGTKDPSLGGLLRWRADPDWSLDVQVQPTPRDHRPCSGPRCAEIDGAELSWYEPGEDAPGYLRVAVVRGGELRSVGFESYGAGDPRGQELFVDLDELAAIVTDPAFSLQTTQAAVDAGERLGD